MILENRLVKELIIKHQLNDEIVKFQDEFRAPVADATNVFSEEVWVEKSTNNSTIAPIVAIGGGLLCSLTSDSEAQSSGVETPVILDPTAGLVFEAKLIISTAPTLSSQIVAGLIDATPVGAIADKAGAIFSVDSDLVLDVNTDDDATDVSGSTGQTLVLDTEYRLNIDMTETNDVKFYLDGARLNAGTTYNMSAIASTDLMLATVQVGKASGAGLGVIKIKSLGAAHTV